MQHLAKLLMLITAMMILQACDDDSNSAPFVEIPDPVVEEPVTNTIVDVAVANGSFTTLVAALQATGLDATLADTSGTFTVFAPTDDAFALLGEDTINNLLADTDTLSDILTYHVIGAEVNAEAAVASAGTKVEMVNGDMVGLSLMGDSLLVNGVTVTATDIMTDNGIIHVIDAVLMPPADRGEPTMNIVEAAVGAGSFTTLVTALQATGLDAALANPDMSYTVFAPTDAAFAMIDADTMATLLANPDVLSSILLQHVVGAEVDSITAYTLSGQAAETLSGAMINIGINSDTDMLTFGGANIVTKDIYTSNGVIHVIDAVVVGDVAIPEPAQSIVDVAVANGNFTILATALEAAGLVGTLSNLDAQFTVFAPTDAAFALLPAGTVESLLADPQALANILLYHVITDATIMADAAIGVAQSDNKKVTMANGQMAALSLGGSNLYVNTSHVGTADVMAANGVIHVIDTVMMPPAMMGEPTMSIVDVAVGDPNFSTLVAALTAADLVSTLADENANFTVFAPTNAAFNKIDSTVLSGLLGNTDALSKVLLQHVVPGTIDSVSAYAANGAMVDTAANEDVSVKLVDFTMTTNGESDEVAYHAMYEMLVGGMGSGKDGMTLYVFDNDLGTTGSNCNDDCAVNWPPVLVEDGDVSNIMGLSTVMRADGTMQAAYLGRPLYFFVNDESAGDMNGQGLGGAWWTVKLPQVSLQVQGSNVVTKDIYTTNGVIHVIDTVITETLE